MTRRKTDADFKQEVFDLVGDEYVFLDTYVNTNTKIKVKHNKCGNIYEVAPVKFLLGRRCPYCFGIHKKSNKQFKREVYDLVGNEYTFLDAYVNARTKLRVKHNNCGNVYKVKPNNFLNGSRCPYCYGTSKKTDTQFKQEVKNLVGNEYTFLDSYVDAKTKLKVKHNTCGNIYEVQPNTFLSAKRRCPYCFGTNKKTTAEFDAEVCDLVGNEYTFLDSYSGAKTKIKVKHNICGNIYEVQPTNFIQGYRCPYCSSSKGEDIINKILKLLGTSYECQKTFDDLSDKTNLSYDFFIPDQNILIEYQGIQHYQSVDHFGGEARFELQQKHDKMKDDYAKSHHYNLITVPYTEDTFSKIKKYLIKHGLKK